MRYLIDLSSDWNDIVTYLPSVWDLDPVQYRPATAVNFVASLELVREGRIEVWQANFFLQSKFARRSLAIVQSENDTPSEVLLM